MKKKCIISGSKSENEDNYTTEKDEAETLSHICRCINSFYFIHIGRKRLVAVGK
jgi:hypothetical protein